MLIVTLFNEADNVSRWWDCLMRQTVLPDEVVIVDGGSTDGTPERLHQAFGHGDFPAPRIIIEKCNIVRGRDAQHIAEAMLCVAKDRDLCRCLDESAHKKGAVNNAWQDCGDRLLAEYAGWLNR